MIFLLLLVALPLSYGSSQYSAIRIHQAEVYRLKCDKLPYRSYYSSPTCYFSISQQITVDDAARQCNSVFPGAKFQTFPPTHLWSTLYIDKSAYHTSSLSPGSKKIICEFSNHYSCPNGEISELPGRCLERAPNGMNYEQAVEYCARSRNGQLPLILNKEENLAIQHMLGGGQSIWLRPSVDNGGKWTAAPNYLQWTHDARSGIQCSSNTAISMVDNSASQCNEAGDWKMAPTSQINTVVCVREMDSPFYKPKEVTTTTTTTTTTTQKPTTTNEPTTTSTTTTSTTTTTTRRPTTTTAADRIPPSSAFINLKYYYNYGRILHAFAADLISYNAIMRNGIGYQKSKGSGSLGKMIYYSFGAIGDAKKACPKGFQSFRKLGFTRSGNAYVHNLNGRGLKMGYVTRTYGACGFKRPIKAWKCRFSADIMYAQNLQSNTFYRGMVRHGGAVQFYLY